MNFPVWAWAAWLPMALAPFNTPKPAGRDFSGTVLSSGPESGFAVGDEVMGLLLAPGAGTLVEALTVDTAPGQGGCVVKKPRGWSMVQAAAMPLVWLTAEKCIAAASTHAPAGRPAKIVVLGGSSGVGMYVVHLAKQRGWEVHATCSGRNSDFVREMGAAKVTDYTATSVPEAVAAYKPDAIVDCVGGVDCLHLAPRFVTIVGDKTTRSSMGGSATYLWNPRMLLRWAIGRVGLGVAYDCVNLEPIPAALEEATKLPADKVIIDSTFTFDKTKDAFERLNTSRARGKVVVTIDS